MDLLSLGFLLLILIASGAIAYAADRLGKKLGKKRLSIRVGRWSLRPKHVATLGTVVMGVLVSALSIGLLAASSWEAREWLRKGRGLILDVKRLSQEADGLERRVDAGERRNRELQAHNGDLEAKNQRLSNGLRYEQKNLAVLRAQRTTLQAQTQTLIAQVKELQGDLLSRRRELIASRRALAGSKRLLTQGHLALGKAQMALLDYEQKILAAQRSLRTSNSNVASANKRVDESYKTSLKTYQDLKIVKDQVEASKALVTELTAQQTKAEDDYKAAQDKLKGTQDQLANLSDQATALNVEVDRLQEVARGQQSLLQGGFVTSRMEGMTFRRGEELARVVVPAGADPETASNVLESLLRAARMEATERGAKGRTANGVSYGAADLMDRKDLRTGESIDPEAVRRAVVAGIAGGRGERVLVASSTLNAFAGEPVSLDIAVLPNPLVYHRNDTVAEARIDGGQDERAILAQVSRFVQGPVRDRARRDRMVPRVGTAAPFGEPSGPEVWSLAQSVRRVGKPVRVQAVAEQDIRAADPLRLEFRVR